MDRCITKVLVALFYNSFGVLFGRGGLRKSTFDVLYALLWTTVLCLSWDFKNISTIGGSVKCGNIEMANISYSISEHSPFLGFGCLGAQVRSSVDVYWYELPR
jgi:hypothetical protein